MVMAAAFRFGNNLGLPRYDAETLAAALVSLGAGYALVDSLLQPERGLPAETPKARLRRILFRGSDRLKNQCDVAECLLLEAFVHSPHNLGASE